MKRLIISALIIGLVFGTSGPIRAEDNDIKVLVNGKPVVSDAPAINVESRVMLPFRAILNAIGIPDSEIGWDDKSKTMEIRHNQKYVFLAIGSRGVVVDQSMIMLDPAPMINQGRTMIPVRTVEIFGASVQWDGNNNTVTIKTK